MILQYPFPFHSDNPQTPIGTSPINILLKSKNPMNAPISLPKVSSGCVLLMSARCGRRGRRMRRHHLPINWEAIILGIDGWRLQVGRPVKPIFATYVNLFRSSRFYPTSALTFDYSAPATRIWFLRLVNSVFMPRRKAAVRPETRPRTSNRINTAPMMTPRSTKFISMITYSCEICYLAQRRLFVCFSLFD